MKIYINGKFYAKEKAMVSVFDHGLLYGDGVFEGIRTYNNRVFMLEEHIERLYASAHAIALDIPISRAKMTEDVVRVCKMNKTSNGYVRLIITRGVGTLGLNPFTCKKPQIIIIASKIQLYPQELYEKGLKVITSGTIRNHPEAINPKIKSLNYLNNILAKIEAINNGVLEVIMLNHLGHVSEASGDNIFIINGQTLMTPPTSSGALDGVTRNVVMNIALECGLQVKEQVLTRYDLYNASEMFLTGSAAEIVSVVEYDKRTIGNGKPGRITKKLRQKFIELTMSSGVPIA